jgi:hypothetical protein
MSIANERSGSIIAKSRRADAGQRPELALASF